MDKTKTEGESRTSNCSGSPPPIVKGGHESVNDFLRSICDEVTHFKSPEPLPELHGKHLEFDYFWFHLNEDDSGSSSSVRVHSMDPKGDYVNVDLVNRQSGSDKVEDGYSFVGLCTDMEALLAFIKAGVVIAMDRCKRVA